MYMEISDVKGQTFCLHYCKDELKLTEKEVKIKEPKNEEGRTLK